jgi:hypothetical protein
MEEFRVRGPKAQRMLCAYWFVRRSGKRHVGRILKADPMTPVCGFMRTGKDLEELLIMTKILHNQGEFDTAVEERFFEPKFEVGDGIWIGRFVSVRSL